MWGAAISAYQTEGNNANADWWAWERSLRRQEALRARGRNPDRYASGIACDFYNRFEEDFALAEHLGHNTIRLGIEWSRVQPKEGIYDEKALDHYEKMLRSAKAHGLAVFLTLHHFTSPQWFAEKGGFTKSSNLKYFLDFCEKAAARLGDYADFWLTFNEPEIYATHSYLLGIFPPQKKNLWQTFLVIKNIIAAHKAAAKKIKFFTAKPVSMAFHLSDLQPYGIFGGLAQFVAHYLANEYVLKRTAKYCDYIGVNYYNHFHVSLAGRRKSSHGHHEVTDMGWGIHPEGLERVLINLKKFNKPIYITENGLADAKDEKRDKFIKDHLYYTHRAIQKGAAVRGYLHWSLLDNFEWQHGFWPRFGLVEIDRDDLLRRKVRLSAVKYAEICKTNQMEF